MYDEKQSDIYIDFLAQTQSIKRYNRSQGQNGPTVGRGKMVQLLAREK